MNNDKATESLFKHLVSEYGNIAKLSRETGLSRRAIEMKRDGTTIVRKWDVYALMHALSETGRDMDDSKAAFAYNRGYDEGYGEGFEAGQKPQTEEEHERD